MDNRLPRSTPEEQGISSAAVSAFISEAEELTRSSKSWELHSFMLLRHGYVVSEGWWAPYAPELPHMLFSLSKSFTSTAIGLAVAEGKISTEDKVISFFPKDLPEEISENLAAMRIRDLLSMTAGNAVDTLYFLFDDKDGNWVRTFLSRPVEHKPGTHFLYNTGATYMLSAILQQVTGQTLLEYLQPRLFEPLGIEGAAWESCPKGINTGGFGLNVKTEDIARLGQLYLQDGMWQGRQLLTPEWVKEATSFQISNAPAETPEWEQGYGYQFWMCRHGAYRGDGAFGQYCIVLPEKDAVIAITSGVDNMQAVLDLVWKHLLPAFGETPLAPAAAESQALDAKTRGLRLAPPEIAADSPAAAGLSGRRYKLEPNGEGLEAVALDFGPERCRVTWWMNSGEVQEIDCGFGKWMEGEGKLPDSIRFHCIHDTWLGCRDSVPESMRKIAASGTWQDEKTFVLTQRFLETTFYYSVTFCFDGDAVQIRTEANVSFYTRVHPVICGNAH